MALQLAPGHTYKYRVTATDNAGNSSLIKVGLTYKLSVLQENASTVKYSAGWTRQALSGADGGDVDFANVAGKTATLTFSGIQVGLGVDPQYDAEGRPPSSWTPRTAHRQHQRHGDEDRERR